MENPIKKDVDDFSLRMILKTGGAVEVRLGGLGVASGRLFQVMCHVALCSYA